MYDFNFLKGSIETIILNALYSGDKYGYEIAREIKEKTENKYEIKQPTLYGYLKRLEQNDLILSYWGGGDSNGGRRRYYKLTEAGKKVCIDYMSEWNFQRDIIDSLVAQAENDEDIKEISQADATSILGSKTRRTLKKREIVSDMDLEELNKQLNSLKNDVITTQELPKEQSTNNKPEEKHQEIIQHSIPTAPKIEAVRYDVTPDPYRPDATIIMPQSATQKQTTPQTDDSTNKQEKIVEQKENTQKNEEPAPLSINEQLKNTAPAGPQLIFAPTPPSSPIITSSSFKKEKQAENIDSKPSYMSPQPKIINNSPIITNSLFESTRPKQPSQEQKEQPKQQLSAPKKELTDEKQYKQILGNLLENQLDEMSKATFNTPEKFDNALNAQNASSTLDNSTPVPVKNIVKDLEKNGIKASLYNKNIANSYVSKQMIFTNKLRCMLACMLALSLIVEYFLMYFIFKSAVPDLKFTVFTILIIFTCLPAGGFILNYILHPTKKSEKKFNFKFNFINSWILVGSVLAILAIIYFVIIGAGNVKQLLLDFILPFVISLNVPLAVTYYNLLLKFS